MGGVFVADAVLPGTAVERVSAQATFEHIVTAAALQQVVLRITHQHVVLFGADQVLDVFESIARGVRPRVINLLVSAQVHAHAHLGVHIGHGVAAGAAVKHVTTCTAFEGVITSAPVQVVVFSVAHQGVGIGAAQQVLNVGKDITLGVAALVVELAVRCQKNGHALRRAGIAGGVGPCSTVQAVSAAAAFERVVAQTTAQHVGLRVAGQLVVVGTAQQVLDVDEHIALGVTPFIDGFVLQ